MRVLLTYYHTAYSLYYKIQYITHPSLLDYLKIFLLGGVLCGFCCDIPEVFLLEFNYFFLYHLQDNICVPNPKLHFLQVLDRDILHFALLGCIRCPQVDTPLFEKAHEAVEQVPHCLSYLLECQRPGIHLVSLSAPFLGIQV